MDYLHQIGNLDECAKLYVDILNRENFVSRQGKSNHQVRLFSFCLCKKQSMFFFVFL